MANSVTTKLHLFALPCHSSFHKITFQYKYLSSFLKLVNVEQLQFRSFKTTTQNFQIKEVKNKIQASLVQQWNNFYSQYEEFVGVADVQEAQNKVKEVSLFFFFFFCTSVFEIAQLNLFDLLSKAYCLNRNLY